MKTPLLLLLLAIAPLLLCSVPVVSGVEVSQRGDLTRYVDIYYSVQNANPARILVLASSDDGAHWNLPCTLLTGDVGPGISPGPGKHIVWDVLTEHPGVIGIHYKVMVVAIEGNLGGEMVFVQGGTFVPHNYYSNYVVTLSSFYIGKYEVSQLEYLTVTGSNPSHFSSDLTRPVELVRWGHPIEYCNYLSLQEGLTPCYTYYDYVEQINYGTLPSAWPADWVLQAWTHDCIICDWSATGYRLPTEAEYIYAAKGGIYSHNYSYSGSNDINAVAWYSDNSGGTSHSVGEKNPNELDLFDMSGNVWEWGWDKYPLSWPAGTYTDPTEPSFGYRRIVHAGSWNYWWVSCQSEQCNGNVPYTCSPDIGFRVCRRTP